MDANPYRVFHSRCEYLRRRLHVVLVRPEGGGNVGAIARALANMGLHGKLILVGKPLGERLGEAERLAVHARDRLRDLPCFPDLASALESLRGEGPLLTLAATARVGSSDRPHPLWARPAVERAMTKLEAGEVQSLAFVFGPESSGLTNEDVALCDWVVTIPSVDEYRSLNLAQAVLVFAYEANLRLLENPPVFVTDRPGQRDRLVRNLLQLAEEAGFILPGDPHKMRPHLEGLLERLPRHLPDARTLHGLLDQVRRSLRKGAPDVRGRYRNLAGRDEAPGREP